MYEYTYYINCVWRIQQAFRGDFAVSLSVFSFSDLSSFLRNLPAKQSRSHGNRSSNTQQKPVDMYIYIYIYVYADKCVYSYNVYSYDVHEHTKQSDGNGSGNTLQKPDAIVASASRTSRCQSPCSSPLHSGTKEVYCVRAYILVCACVYIYNIWEWDLYIIYIYKIYGLFLQSLFLPKSHQL